MEAMIVSEDAEFIARAQRLMRSSGTRAVGCLGPVDASWLPAGVGLALVDAPPSGAFASGEWPPRPGDEVPAASYAEELADRHPGLVVVVCNAPEGLGGPGGGVPCVDDREVALRLLSSVAR